MALFQKGQSGNPAGKPPGTLNKVGQQAKEVIAQAAEGLGGTRRLLEWAKEAPENERAFWTSIYPRLMPVQTEVSGPDGTAIRQIVNNYLTPRLEQEPVIVEQAQPAQLPEAPKAVELPYVPHLAHVKIP